MLGNDRELRFELLKVILSNPANKFSEIDIKDISGKLTQLIQQAVWERDQEEKP